MAETSSSGASTQNADKSPRSKVIGLVKQHNEAFRSPRHSVSSRQTASDAGSVPNAPLSVGSNGLDNSSESDYDVVEEIETDDEEVIEEEIETDDEEVIEEVIETDDEEVLEEEIETDDEEERFEDYSESVDVRYLKTTAKVKTAKVIARRYLKMAAKVLTLITLQAQRGPLTVKSIIVLWFRRLQFRLVHRHRIHRRRKQVIRQAPAKLVLCRTDCPKTPLIFVTLRTGVYVSW